MKYFDIIFYGFIKITVGIIFRLLYRLDVVNGNVIPKSGGVLLAGNHSSWFDTLFLTCAMKRPVWFVTGEFILKVPILGTLVKHLCVIPISKNNGQDGISQTVEKLKEGNIVCIFPEGQLSKNGELQRFRNGISQIYKQSLVPVIPFYLDGAYETWSYGQQKPKFFKKVTLRFGEKFIPLAQKDVEIAQEVQEQVLALK